MTFKRAILCAVAAVLVACGGERVERPDSDPAAIGFSTPVVAARGAAVTTPALLAGAGGFTVWAYSHAGDWDDNNTRTALIDGVGVTSPDNGATWEYASPAKWPVNNDKASFFAYSAVAGGTITYDNTYNTPQLTYSVAAELAQQQDLLFAGQLNLHGYDYYPERRKVELNFQHAFSQISFSACYAGTKYPDTVALTKIVLKNVYNTGTAPLTVPVGWTLASATADYTLTAGEELAEVQLTPTPADVLAGDKLYLMPQAINGDRPAGPVEMEVSFEVAGGTLSYTTPILQPVAWQPGKSYNYQIILDDEAIQVIVVDNDTGLNVWGGSIMLQTVALSSYEFKKRDEDNITYALFVFNEVNTSSSGRDYFRYYGVYGVNDVNHDMMIDAGAYDLSNFKPGQFLLFDFKKTIRTWGTNSAEGDRPWQITVHYDEEYWELMPSQQNLEPDAVSGATGPASNTMTARGSIILKKNDTLYPVDP